MVEAKAYNVSQTCSHLSAEHKDPAPLNLLVGQQAGCPPNVQTTEQLSFTEISEISVIGL